MIKTFEKALAVQSRRYEAGKTRMARSVKRFLKNRANKSDAAQVTVSKLNQLRAKTLAPNWARTLAED